jgi:Ran GTPase-activating protein (RanGAP) involved in mRNA processing and transport
MMLLETSSKREDFIVVTNDSDLELITTSIEKIEFQGFFTPECIEILVEKRARITEIEVRNVRLSDFSVEQLCTCDLKRLERLRLVSCGLTENHAISIANAFKGREKLLRELMIASNHIGDRGVEALCDAFVELESISLSDTKISRDGVMKVMNHVRETGIRSVFLDEDDWDSNVVHTILVELQNCSSVISFTLRLGQFTDRESKLLGEIIASNDSMDYLCLDSSNMNALGMQYLSKALVANNHLEMLDLSGTILEVAGIIDLAFGIRTNKCIAHLVLSGCGIGNAGLKALILGLYGNSSIEHLYLDSNDITEVECISKFIYDTNRIRTLIMAKNAIGDFGGIQFANLLKNVSCIQELDISNCGLSIQVQFLFKSILLETCFLSLKVHNDSIEDPSQGILTEILEEINLRNSKIEQFCDRMELVRWISRYSLSRSISLKAELCAILPPIFEFASSSNE